MNVSVNIQKLEINSLVFSVKRGNLYRIEEYYYNNTNIRIKGGRR